MDRTSSNPSRTLSDRQRELREQVEALIQRAQPMKAWLLLRDVPDDELDDRLRHLRWGLDPTGVVSRPASETENTVLANRDWLDAHRDDYRGQWVALFCGELLAHAETAPELTRKLEAMGRRARALIIKL